MDPLQILVKTPPSHRYCMSCHPEDAPEIVTFDYEHRNTGIVYTYVLRCQL
jgi:hypothetical protein